MSASIHREPLGPALQRHREARGRYLTRGELARRAGYSPAYVGRVERGVRHPSAEYLYAIAPHLGVRPDNLLLLAGYLNDEGRWAGPDPPDPAGDILAQARAVLECGVEQGAWSLNVTAPIYALLVECATQRRTQTQADRDADRREWFERGIQKLWDQLPMAVGPDDSAPATAAEVLQIHLARLRSYLFPQP